MVDSRLTHTGPNYPFVDCCICLDYYHKNQTSNGITLKLPNRNLSSWKTVFTNNTQKAAESPPNCQEKSYIPFECKDTQCFDTTLNGPSLHCWEIFHGVKKMFIFSLSNWLMIAETESCQQILFEEELLSCTFFFYTSHVLENLSQSKNDLSWALHVFCLLICSRPYGLSVVK